MPARRTRLPVALSRRLAAIVGREHVLEAPDLVAPYAVDWTRRFHGSTSAVVRPADADQVGAVLADCQAAGLAVVPQGGNTGLVAGATPYDGALTLSLTRLDQVGPVDGAAGQLTAGSGATLARVAAAARAAGWHFGVDLAARDSATIGGMVATNAGGLHVLRWGPMRANVAGVRAITVGGARVGDLRGLLKDNTGYHWPSILCGSEGTLAVVTDVRVSLVVPVPNTVVALVGFASAEAAIGAASILRHGLRDVSAIEFMVDSGVALVRDVVGLPAPFPDAAAAYLLVECRGDTDLVAPLAAAVDSLAGVTGAAVGEDSVTQTQLWRYREAHTEAVATRGAAHKLDVTLPAGELAGFVHDVPRVVAAVRPAAATWLFGHAGDGNVHVNVTGVAEDDDDVDGVVLELAAARGGSISAEHGIGRAKRRWLHLNRTAEEMAAFRSLKRALDPDGLLNPGVLVD